ncbi:MAG: hypothetical protein Q9201_007304 [Fulgogasparrea decipioides]
MATSLTLSHTNSADEYDHAINLVDATKPSVDSAQVSTDDAPEASGASLSRRWTRGTLRKELAKRKYAKWQQDRGQVEGVEHVTASIDNNAEETSKASLETGQQKLTRGTRLGLRRSAKSKEDSSSKQSQNQDSIIDVLYENQRGWFLFGVPLYSANSLLNLDPAPWQTSSFKDSPVDITNAQVPDPSWEWAWRTWYVDMSHDVDEEGWEYSFSFQARFAWHGSHPWFHSFARRRRWLRKRVKVHPSKAIGSKGTMKESHLLNADYFTIHRAKLERSPESSAEGTLANRSSYTGYDGNESDSDQDLNDIPNVVALLAVLKRATVDREKIVAVRTFLAQGGDELHYLADIMDEILGLLIYQTSRQQLFNYLLEGLDKAKSGRDSESGKEEKDREELHRKIDNLSRAVDVSLVYLSGLEYWENALESGRIDDSGPNVAPAFGKDDMDWPEETKAHIEEENANNEIRGIPEGADIDVAPSPLRTSQSQADDSAGATRDKGKGRTAD